MQQIHPTVNISFVATNNCDNNKSWMSLRQQLYDRVTLWLAGGVRAAVKMPGVEKMHLFAEDDGQWRHLRRAYAVSPPQPAAERKCRTIFHSRTPAHRRTIAGDDWVLLQSPHQIQKHLLLSCCRFPLSLHQRLIPKHYNNNFSVVTTCTSHYCIRIHNSDSEKIA